MIIKKIINFKYFFILVIVVIWWYDNKGVKNEYVG